MNNGYAQNVLKKERIVAILKKIPAFAGLQNHEYESLLTAFTVDAHPAGRFLFREGDRGYSFYVLLTGKIEVATESAGVLYVMSPCEILGEVAIVSDQPRSASAKILEDAVLLEIHRDHLDILVRTAPRVSFVIMRNMATALAERLVRANARLSGVALERD